MKLKHDTKYKRGYRYGLRMASDMVKRFAHMYEGREEVQRALTILANEIPMIGLDMSAPGDMVEVGEPNAAEPQEI